MKLLLTIKGHQVLGEIRLVIGFCIAAQRNLRNRVQSVVIPNRNTGRKGQPFTAQSVIALRNEPLVHRHLSAEMRTASSSWLKCNLDTAGIFYYRYWYYFVWTLHFSTNWQLIHTLITELIELQTYYIQLYLKKRK